MLMTSTLKDKVAVVTGGTRGIGYCIADRLLEEGAKVYICGRDAEILKQSLAQLRAQGKTQVEGLAADVGRYEDCRKLIHTAAEHFGGIDILVNNAGIGIMKIVDQLTPAEWDATIHTNLSGPFYCCREAIPFMRRRGGGYIFNISSLAGVNPFPGGMMQDVRYDGIRVSYIMPGSVDTEFGGAPGSRSYHSWKLSGEDIAKAVVDLYTYPLSSLASRIEMRPSQPPRKK
jgi:NAD(P)-dependent dehydrogenase (short-subunit alcohol dehydrogenase family)